MNFQYKHQDLGKPLRLTRRRLPRVALLFLLGSFLLLTNGARIQRPGITNRNRGKCLQRQHCLPLMQ